MVKLRERLSMRSLKCDGQSLTVIERCLTNYRFCVTMLFTVWRELASGGILVPVFPPTDLARQLRHGARENHE